MIIIALELSVKKRLRLHAASQKPETVITVVAVTLVRFVHAGYVALRCVAVTRGAANATHPV